MMNKRTEYGFERTYGTSDEDILNCKHMPSFLVPADLDRMSAAAGFMNCFEFGMQFLLASPGALVVYKGSQMRIRTLVPARNLGTGYCRWLSKDCRCKIHEHAPFGCAFFDATMGIAESQERSQAALQDILGAWRAMGDYASLWCLLFTQGKVAPSPEEGREKIVAEWARGLGA
jgi:Fe-S-cluster containining protein